MPRPCPSPAWRACGDAASEPVCVNQEGWRETAGARCRPAENLAPWRALKALASLCAGSRFRAKGQASLCEAWKPAWVVQVRMLSPLGCARSVLVSSPPCGQGCWAQTLITDGFQSAFSRRSVADQSPVSWRNARMARCAWHPTAAPAPGGRRCPPPLAAVFLAWTAAPAYHSRQTDWACQRGRTNC